MPAFAPPSLSRPRREVGRDASGQDRHVVASFEHADDPAVGVGSRRPRRSLWSETLEVLDFESQVAHRVFGVGIEARADQHESPVLTRSASLLESSAKCRMVVAPRRAIGQGDVHRCSRGPRPVPVSSRAPVPG